METEASSHSSEELSNFQVYVRVRPFNTVEVFTSNDPNTLENQLTGGNETNDTDNLIRSEPNMRKFAARFATKKNYEVIKIDDNLIFLADPENKTVDKKEKTYAFNGVFGSTSINQHVFETAFQPNLETFLKGFNTTFFAYGMTGSGKTHTIFGTPDASGNDVGVTNLSFEYLFQRVHQEQGDKKWVLKFSYLEIYNEQVKDLLSDHDRPLTIIEDPDRGVIVQELKEYEVIDCHQVEELIKIGNQKRTLAPTLANQFSSRSHAIIQVTLEIKDKCKNYTEEVTSAKLRIIDLAGSERGSNVNIRGGRGLIEGANINKSLLALGNCINILSDRTKKAGFVPYRDSKLTRLLKDSLGGNTKTVMIACISPSSLCFEETLNTLNYASRARNIKTKVSRNRKEVEVQVTRYKEIISNLKNENDFLREMVKQNVMSMPITPAQGLGDTGVTDTGTIEQTRDKALKDANFLKSLAKMEYIECNNEESRKLYSDNMNRIIGERNALVREIEELQVKLQKSRSNEDGRHYTKDDYLERISHDLLANFEERWEIKQSLNEIDEILIQNYNKLAVCEKSLEEEHSEAERTEINEEIGALNRQNEENSEIREKLENAMEVNSNQKDILKNLFFHLQEEKKRESIELEIQLAKQKLAYCDLMQQNFEVVRESHQKGKFLAENDLKIQSLENELATLKGHKGPARDSRTESGVLKQITSTIMNGSNSTLHNSSGMTPSEKRVLTPKNSSKPKSIVSTVIPEVKNPAPLPKKSPNKQGSNRRKTFTDNFFKEHSKTTQGKFIEAQKSPSEIESGLVRAPTVETINPKVKRFLYNDSFRNATQGSSKSPDVRHQTSKTSLPGELSKGSFLNSSGNNSTNNSKTLDKPQKPFGPFSKLSNSRMQTEPLFVVSPHKTLKEVARAQKEANGARNKSLNPKREPAVATIVLFGADKANEKHEAFKSAKLNQKEGFSKSEIPVALDQKFQLPPQQHKRRSTSQRYSRAENGNCYLETEMSIDSRQVDKSKELEGLPLIALGVPLHGDPLQDQENKTPSLILREHEIQFHSIAKLNQSQGKVDIPKQMVDSRKIVFDSQQFVNPLKSYNDEFAQPTTERLDTLGDNLPNMGSIYRPEFDNELIQREILPKLANPFESSTKTRREAILTDGDNDGPLDSAMKNPLETISDTNDQMSSGCDSPVLEKNSRMIYTNPPGKVGNVHYGLELAL